MIWETSKHPVILLVSIIILLPSVRSQDQNPYVCLRNGNYTRSSTYSANLNTSLSSLSRNMGNSGFNNASVGRNPDRANALALCRADTTLDQCRTCVQNAVVGVLQLCPNQKQAIIWYEYCIVRYSNEPIYGTETNDPGTGLLNTAEVANPVQFRDDRTRLLDNLRAKAANGSSVMKAGAGSRNTTDSETLYALVQCTPDLSGEECDNCLVRAGQFMSSCCDRARGVRTLFPSCIIRYELYPFYNETRLREFQGVLSPTPPSPPTPSPPGTWAQPGCLNAGGDYTANSTYRTNLNAALSALSINVDVNGFSNVSVGQNADTVYASVLCRGDVQLENCRECARNASVDLVQSCPNKKQAILLRGLCVLRYSNEMIYGKLDTSPLPLWYSIQNASNRDTFNEELRKLLDELRVQAASGDNSLRKVAARSATGAEFLTIFALVQCTPDLSPADCSSCLSFAIGGTSWREDIARKIAGAVGTPSCNVRFATYPFFNETRLQELATAPNRPPILPPPGQGDNNKNNKKTKTVIIIVVTIVVCLSLVPCGIIFLRKRKTKKPREILESTDEISTIEHLQYDFGIIRAATDNFSNGSKLGQGGFGSVYKGKLLNGEEIAVKRLSKNSGQGGTEFKNEVLLLAKVQHRNLVRLLGFSLEGTERLLIYELVKNSSLDRFIFDPIKRSYLDWNIRYKIIWGIARGLLYLHEDSRHRIIHRDLKASNILLDTEMNPKIADFGMARLFEEDETEGNTNRIVGTYGYMAPEYAMHGQFSPKSDVFSFGVLVLELLSGRRNSYIQHEENVEDLLSLMWKNWREGMAANVIDPILRVSTDFMRDILRCIHLALLCVQEKVVDRPTMTSIVQMLNSFTITLPVPKEPAFFVDSPYGPKFSKGSNSSNASKTKVAKSKGSSLNYVSITELCPR